jgi:hypothetical protein
MNQDLSTALGLLETKRFALQAPGLFVDHRWYNSPELDALKDDNLGEKGRPGLQIQVWIDDRHPEFIYALPPNVPAPIAIRDRDASAPAPPLADLLDRELRNAVGVEALFGSDRKDRQRQVETVVDVIDAVARERAVTPERGRSKAGSPKGSSGRSHTSAAAPARANASARKADNRTDHLGPVPNGVDLAARFDQVLGKGQPR